MNVTKAPIDTSRNVHRSSVRNVMTLDYGKVRDARVYHNKGQKRATSSPRQSVNVDPLLLNDREISTTNIFKTLRILEVIKFMLVSRALS